MAIRSFIALVGVGLLLSLAVHAGEQQDKMKSCNVEAAQKELKGDKRKAFMKTCLSAKHEASAPPATQQEKMKTCNAAAKNKNLSGDERKKFMSQCLSSMPAV
jgi:hypothetical protein